MAAPEFCRHDRWFSAELSSRLNDVSFLSREVIPTSRPRDIDRRTEAMLRKALTGFRQVHLSEDKLSDVQGILLSGPYKIYAMVLDKDLTARERNRLMLHFAGVIATGNLGEFGLHRETTSPDESQKKADSEADKWVQSLRDTLLAGKNGKTVFALGIQRALS